VVEHLIGQIGQKKFQAMNFFNQIFKIKKWLPKISNVDR
jgi:hypothetical protein